MIDFIVAAVMKKLSLPTEDWPAIYSMAKGFKAAGFSDDDIAKELEFMIKAAQKIAESNLFDLSLMVFHGFFGM